MEIIPAVPFGVTLDELRVHLQKVRGIAPVVQIDVVDGILAPSKTWPYTERDSFTRILSEREGMPFWEDLDFEIDLITSKSVRDAKEWVMAGAARLIVHLHSPDARAAIDYLQDYRQGQGVEVGLALSLDVPVDAVRDYAGLYDYVQLMGIARVGFQGEKLDERVYARVREMKKTNPEAPLQVDGGVTLDTAPLLKEEGATRLALTSALFKSSDIKETYRTLSAL